MKTEQKIRESMQADVQMRDKLVAELNACLGRIQAYSLMLVDDLEETKPSKKQNPRPIPSKDDTPK